MNYSRCILFAVILILMPFATDTAFACFCSSTPSTCALYSNADAVFAGKVTEVSSYVDKKGDRIRSVRFSIKEGFQSVQEKREIELQTLITSCEFTFKRGKTYFVYAFDNGNGGLATANCSGTTEIQNADEDLSFARRKVVNISAEQSVSGQMVDLSGSPKPVDGTQIVIKKNHKTYTLFLDGNGFFKLPLTEPGKYQISIFVPKNFAPDSYISGQPPNVPKTRETETHSVVEYEVVIKKGGCIFIVTRLAKTI